MKITPSFVLVVALLLSACVASAEENWTMAPAKNVTLRSEALQRNTRLQIGLPSDYETTNTAYGVVYCLDGFVIGGTVRETAQLLHFGDEMPEVITVSIDLEVNSVAEWYQERSFILTPTKSDFHKDYGIPESRTGGAPLFLKALADEIIPFIDKNYRTLPGKRTLVGHSYGGLFAAYVLFESPHLFDRYLISSPSLPWDDRVILKLESQYAKTHKDLSAKVFLSVGALENAPHDMMVDDLRELADALRLRKYARLELTSIVFENESHFSVPPVAYSRGLRVLYADNKEKLMNLSK